MSKQKIESNGLTFTWNNKCDCYQFNLPPRQSCPGVRERLKNPRSICNYCYAKFGRFGQMETSQIILQRNLQVVRNTPLHRLYPKFLAGLSLATRGQEFFRWFGCGDIVNDNLLKIIISSARAFPEVNFWCPTQTGARGQATPSNLSLRNTGGIVGESAPIGGQTTLLPEQKKLPGHFVCPGKCDPCRKCWEPWNPKTRIAFPFHGGACLMAKFNKARRIHKF